MIEIYKVIRQIYVDEKTGQSSIRWSHEYQKGYRFCMGLLLTAIERHPTFNVHLEKIELEKQIEITLLDKQEIQRKASRLQSHNKILLQELAREKESNQQMTSLLNLNNQNTLKGMVAILQQQNRQLQEELNGLKNTQSVDCQLS